MNFRLNFSVKTVVLVLIGLAIIWSVSTCGCIHGGAYGLYEGITDIANSKDGAGVTVKTGVPVVAVDKKTVDAKKSGSATVKKPSTASTAMASASSAPAPVPTTAPTTDKKGNASVSSTASPANPKEGYTNLMGYNSNNSTVNWGYPAPVSNYVPPADNTPLAHGELDMFANTEFKPECCPTTYSNSMGCACINKDQYNYLITRGGNNVPFDII
jgi:hypothetical protein